MANRTRIDRLHLRIPGMTREQANRLGVTVAEQLARELPASARSGNIGNLRVRVAIPSGAPRARLSSMIAAGIIAKIS
jgi:hypothetical protein